MEETAGLPPQHERSLWRGALISPWVVPVGLALVLGILWFVGSFFGSDNDPHMQRAVSLALVLLIVFFGVPFTYVVTFVFVVPMALLLRSRQALSAARLCLWCALLGPATLYFYAWLMRSWPASGVDALGVGLAMCYGLMSGAAFCRASRVRLFAHRRSGR